MGVTASVTHYLVALSAYALGTVPAWIANLVGFGVAVPVSYFGHACLTFATSRSERVRNLSHCSAVRFGLTALVTLLVSQVATLVLVSGIELPPALAFAIVVALAATGSFLANKHWTFSAGGRRSRRLLTGQAE